MWTGMSFRACVLFLGSSTENCLFGFSCPKPILTNHSAVHFWYIHKAQKYLTLTPQKTHLSSFLRRNKQVPSSEVFVSWIITQSWVNSLIQDKLEIAAGSYVTGSRKPGFFPLLFKKWTNIFKLCVLSLLLMSSCCLSDSRPGWVLVGFCRVECC